MKISFKFIPRVMFINNKKKIVKPVPTSIERVPSPPSLLLPAKFKNEVNTISKYFKGNKTMTNPIKLTKSYA